MKIPYKLENGLFEDAFLMNTKKKKKIILENAYSTVKSFENEICFGPLAELYMYIYFLHNVFLFYFYMLGHWCS